MFWALQCLCLKSESHTYWLNIPKPVRNLIHDTHVLTLQPTLLEFSALLLPLLRDGHVGDLTVKS